ncbi:MAG: bifunctional [glutamate--ammonia ligase]-adenylyl-L-tyrosine phosphorylase/[glutamate--ammonia-ligase] adenylyltransferase [Myxococcota bacterium]|nr:bifunctional [glutamate--ammonia ligase]-adenylyl-L-tyrosine phosphorylase/[glutamate--ammonia-ligase] adenylyltransferase [Myxococcota bacterium]
MRAKFVAPLTTDDSRRFVRAALARVDGRPREEAIELGAIIASAYPALGRAIEAHPENLAAIARGIHRARDLRTYRRLASVAVGDVPTAEAVRRGLRRLAVREKLRIAARELLANPDVDVDVTARELSDLAEACCEVAVAEALAWAESRFGVPLEISGKRCPFAVIGMGKLGGRELNAGSDVDVMLFYGNDEGSVRGRDDMSLHEYFTRVAQRFVATLDEPTEDGIVWRVDLRLRPEGTRGPLVNALAAAERYYEAWGRTWERAALVRARPVAGDLVFGEGLLEAFVPFVWRRAVEPRIVEEMTAMLARARAEAGHSVKDDLKIGPGGIREVEFFAQSLQLVWGGREPHVRRPNTLDALRRLRAGGFVSEREAAELSESYLFLRRLEHRVQFATGQQTHTIPSDRDLLSRIARSLGYLDAPDLERELEAVRARVSLRFGSIGREPTREDEYFETLWAAIDSADVAAVASASQPRFGAAALTELPRHLLALARRPDRPLDPATRDREPDLCRRLIDALADAADPEQAARLLASLFSRLVTPGVYVRALAGDPRLVRALCSLLGASVFLGEALVGHPDLVDRVIYARGVPTPAVARAQVDEEVAALNNAPADVDSFAGALRRAKRRVTFEVGLADLAGELATHEAGHVLAALADATLGHACRFAMREHDIASGETDLEATRGLTLLAMGKLGGREIGYGSDLDLVFVYEKTGEHAPELFARIAQRVLRLVGSPHGEGPGYELDTRLRPSGSHGLLVVSIDAFARYHAEQAEPWERQALVKARVCAGDVQLGARVIAIANAAAYERGAPPPALLHHLRTRMERELAHERLPRDGAPHEDTSPARFDLKLGRGGLVDIEFATQWLQMRYGSDRRVRSTETSVALSALEACGYLRREDADTLREGWRFLRALEQRLRVAHGRGATLLEEGAPGLVPLARRMGVRDGPRTRADEALLEQYVGVTREVRATYLRTLGLPEATEATPFNG